MLRGELLKKRLFPFLEKVFLNKTGVSAFGFSLSFDKENFACLAHSHTLSDDFIRQARKVLNWEKATWRSSQVIEGFKFQPKEILKKAFTFSKGKGVLMIAVSNEKNKLSELLELVAISFSLLLEAELEKTEEQFLLESFLQTTPDLIVLADSRGRVLFKNKEEEDGLFRMKGNFLLEVGSREITQLLEDLRRKGSVSFDFFDERSRKFYTITARLFLEKDTLILHIADMTYVRSLMEIVARENRLTALGRLCVSLAHEFNNRLNVIVNLIELAREERGAKLRSYIKEAREEAFKIADLIRKLLKFARGERFKALIEIPGFLRGIIRLLSASFPENVVIRERFERNLWKVEMDVIDLETLVTNIMTNAMEAMPAGGEILVEVKNVKGEKIGRPGEKFVMLVFTDTGKGMDEMTKRRIFEPFFSTKKEGAGLGLFYVKEIVERWGGKIEVFSQKGEGTRIEVYLPALEEEPGEKMEEEEVSIRLERKLKVLLVENDEKVRNVLKRVLESMGAQVFSVKDGMEALRIYDSQEGRFDLILSDNIMPGMNGLELFYFLQERNPEVKFIMLTGYMTPEEVEKLKESGIKEVLIKPFGLQKLKKALVKALQ